MPGSKMAGLKCHRFFPEVRSPEILAKLCKRRIILIDIIKIDAMLL